MARRISHVGVIVRDIEEALEVYTRVLGFRPPPAGIIDVPEMGVKSALLPIGNNYIELLESTDPNNMTSQVLEQRGEGLLHIAIEVDDVSAEVKSLQERGVEVVDVPPAGEIVDYHSAFIMPDSAKGVPLELVPKGIAHRSQRKRLGLEVTDAPLPE